MSSTINSHQKKDKIRRKFKTSSKVLLFLSSILLSIAFLGLLLPTASAQDMGAVAVDMANEMRELPVTSTVRIMVVLTGITFLPGLLLSMTPFLRFIIVLSMLRQAVGLQQSPPNRVLVAISLFLTILLMGDTFTLINEVSLTPFMNGELETVEAFGLFMEPMREFMFANTRKEELNAIINISKMPQPNTLEEIPNIVVITSFILSELKTAFVIGVKIYLPFLIIDVVVANILLGMGMMVLPPVVISLPFKLLLFVLMDGWMLLIRMMSASFYGLQ